MSKPASRCSTVLTIPALLAFTILPASATVTKTWVSSTGTDSGSCPLTAPCKTFQYAHDQTTAGGEIDVKDTGSYGQLTITKAISIVSGDGALAAVGVPSGGTGIEIMAGPDDKVVLQGLVIDGHLIGGNGIKIDTGASLEVVSCHIRNLTSSGVAINGTTKTFEIFNTEISNAYKDVLIAPSSVTSGSIVGSTLTNAIDGIYATNTNTNVASTSLINNTVGLDSSTNGNVSIGQSAVYGNNTGIGDDQNGVITSYGDNKITSNVNNTYGTIGTVATR